LEGSVSDRACSPDQPADFPLCSQYYRSRAILGWPSTSGRHFSSAAWTGHWKELATRFVDAPLDLLALEHEDDLGRRE
jgi:hypothetical protein